MFELSVTSASPMAFGEESGLDALDYETEFQGVEQGATTRTYIITKAAWERVRLRLRDLSRRRVPNLDGNGAPISRSFKPLLAYTLTPIPGNHPRITVLTNTTPLTLGADGVLVATGLNLLGGVRAKFDVMAQSTATINGTTGVRKFSNPVRALRITAVPFGPRGLDIGFRIKAASGAGSVTTELVGESMVNITVVPAAGANTATDIAAQITADPGASYYITATALSGSTKIGPTYVDPATSNPSPQVTRKEFQSLAGGDGGGLAELFVPVTEGSPLNGLKLVAQKSGNPSNGISLVLRMSQGANAVTVSGKKITVDRTGATETVANIRTAINANAAAAALVLASVRGSGSLGAMTERFLYGGAGEEPLAYVGGAAAVVTEHSDTSLKLTVAYAALAAALANANVSHEIGVQVIVGDRAMQAQTSFARERQNNVFRAAARAQGNITLSGPGAAIDGVTMAAGMRFWAPSQTTPAQDGLYIWNGAATAATRAPEMPAGYGANGALVSIGGGTDAGKVFQVTSAIGSDVVGTDGLADVTLNV